MSLGLNHQERSHNRLRTGQTQTQERSLVFTDPSYCCQEEENVPGYQMIYLTYIYVRLALGACGHNTKIPTEKVSGRSFELLGQEEVP